MAHSAPKTESKYLEYKFDNLHNQFNFDMTDKKLT
jgi:hypothetical protein